MTAQLEFDFTLPAEPGTVQQRAVVFTVLSGEHSGQQTYAVPLPGCEVELVAALDHFAVKWGRTPDARVMVRTVTCGPWEPVT